MPNPISHDQNFKNLILDYSHQALEFFAASEAAHINPGAQITPIRQEQLKNRLGDRFHELDVPLLVEWPDGRRDALLFVLEEETSPQRFSIHRLAHYCLELSEMYGTSRVVPVVIFLRDARRLPTRLQLGGDQLTYLSFQYLKCDLAQLDASHYLDSQNLVARLNLPNMRWPEEQKVDIYAHAMSGLFSLEPDPEKQLKYIDFIDIYTALDDNQMHEYQQRYPQENSKMTGLTERLLQEGIQQGMQQGMQQGSLSVLLRQITRRFGPLDSSTRQRLQQATEHELECWTDNILDAQTLDDVFVCH
ncbi:DUF4351 domain-containing protein [Thiopseudomonas denitrificans]|uniref:Uncharacterized protein DUF4351 n=1 Tax=Thiopseudomonas denitrificans TaxID=1501432 RepID=A0A4R6U455_9GAMM|nr:DUF4351 domain-containing protein [Thiopseudomonas denitrificans]TDQ40242.1 uncharacterized protein DUF4351 [Thiopseudomonas denitrificans]